MHRHITVFGIQFNKQRGERNSTSYRSAIFLFRKHRIIKKIYKIIFVLEKCSTYLLYFHIVFIFYIHKNTIETS